MKKVLTIIIGLVLCITIANAQSTKWFKGTLEQAIQKAKIQDKPVYLQITFNN